MALQDRLAGEMKAAMLAKEAERLSTLRLLKSAIGYVQIERKTENLPDADFVGVVQKEIKKRRDAIEQVRKRRPTRTGRQGEKGNHRAGGFLPPPLSAAELEQLIRAAIQETGATGKKDMGPVIKAVQAKAAGRADGKTISTAVGKLLP